MQRIETTYRELHNKIKNAEQEYFVESLTGYSKIQATCKKTSDTYNLEFTNGYTMIVGDEHNFMNELGCAVSAKDLDCNSYIKTKTGLLQLKSKIIHQIDQDVYDISIEYPHWYVNDDAGIIHHNTAFSLLMAKSYLDKYPDAALLFYDSEFGTPQSYFDTFGIDTSRVVHTPLTDIEQLKFDIMQQLSNVERGDHLIIVIDSIGNLASKKEVDDALDGKSVGDMTRAKQLKSLFRMVTPHLNLKDIPLVVVNHTYMEIGLYPKAIVGGGCLVEGTKIKLSTGELKTIEDICVGEYVHTMDGPKEVTHTWNPETLDDGEPECFEIEFEDGYKVICSDTHKFLIDNTWIEAKELVIGMESAVY